MNDKTLKRIVTAGIIFLVVLITGLNCCSVVDPNERGVAVTLGTVQEGQLEPGMHFKAPFVTTIRKFRIEPKTFEVTHMCKTITARIATMIKGAPAPNQTVESIGTIDHAAPQGIAHARAMVKTFCPQLSITRAPAAPPMVQPKLTRKGITDFP